MNLSSATCSQILSRVRNPRKLSRERGGSGNYALNFAREREGAGARSKILRGSGGERERSQKFFAGAGGAGKRSEKMRGRGGCGRNSPALLLPRDPTGKKKKEIRVIIFGAELQIFEYFSEFN